MKRGDMARIATAQELTCRVCATFPCEGQSAEQYDEEYEDLSDMEIPARVVNTNPQWMERFAS